MNQDARISTALPDHPKTKRLARLLGDGGCWSLVKLFLWAARNRTDGDLSGMDDDDIELAVDWAGQPGALTAALLSVGFLDGEAGLRVIHDWDEHNPWAAGSGDRRLKAQWNAAKRHHGVEAADRMYPSYRANRASRNATSNATSKDSSATSNAPSPSPSPSPSPKAKAGASASGSRLPADWTLTPERRAYCEGKRPDLDPVAVFEDFEDYWRAQPGKSGLKADWDRTWQRWVRNQRAPPRSQFTTGPPPKRMAGLANILGATSHDQHHDPAEAARLVRASDSERLGGPVRPLSGKLAGE